MTSLIRNTSPRGFTLLELIISVAIVAIISSIGFVSYSQAQLLARDSRRKNDLRAIAVALELYRQKNKHYPCNTNTSYQASSGTTFVIKDYVLGGTNCGTGSPAADTTLDSNYISSVPTDPSGNTLTNYPTTSSTGFGYLYWSYGTGSNSSTSCGNSGSWYILATKLENASDPESMGNKNYKWCDGNALNSGNGTPPYNWSPASFVVTSQ